MIKYSKLPPVILPSVEPAASTISSFQAKMALAEAGLLEAVEAVINDPTTPTRIKIAWQESLNFRRDNPMIATIATQLGLSESDIDDLFIAGEQISPDIID